MKHRLLNGLLVILTVLFSGFAVAQDITGTVSDGSGPLPGASVVVKGTQNSASTDLSGKYAIKNAGANAVLVFSYIGLASQEVAVAGKSVVNVVLKDDQEKLKEVVVIGYGSVKKKDATGAVDQLNSKKFDNIAANNPAEILRGKVAGVQVTTSSGEPGASISLRVRGNSSLRSGNEPLIVVDGVPLDGGNISGGGSSILGTGSARSPLNFINQNDIESISVLKDASSTAVYGARGANGVIIITTKRSKSKEPQVSYSSSVSFGKYSGNLDVMSAEQFAQNEAPIFLASQNSAFNSAYNDAIAVAGTTVAQATTAGNIAKNAVKSNDLGGRSYNWKDALLRTGVTYNNDVSVSMGNEKSSTRLSFGANNAQGIVNNSGMDKYTASFSNSSDLLGGFLKLDSKILYTSIKDEAAMLSNNAGFIGNALGAALYWNPTSPIYDNSPDGYYNPGYVAEDPTTAVEEFKYGAENYLNPIQLQNAFKDYTNTSKLLASLNSTVKITNNLKYQFLFGVENSNSSRESQIAPSIRIEAEAQATYEGKTYYGQADVKNVNRFNKTFEHTLTYNKDLNDNINLDLLGGFSYYNYNFDANSATVKGFNPDQVNLIDNLDGGVGSKDGDRAYGPTSERLEVDLQSYFTRASINLYKKFLLNGTYRRDGSSKLGANNKYGNFYSVGAAYKVVEGKEGLVNDFKIRGSYGLTGNQEFPANAALKKANYINPKAFGNQINDNPDLTWETTLSSGVGADFSLLKNRLTGSVDYFVKQTKDLIFAQPGEATQPGPAATKFVNLDGVLENKGIEVALNLKLIDKENFSWDISGNAAFLDNKIKDFKLFVPTGELNGQGLSDATSQVITNNFPAYSYYIYEFRGYDSDGQSIYSDASGNDSGLGTASKKILDKTPLPKMNVGFNTSVTYKNLDMSASFYGAFGHYIYNNTANALFFRSSFPTKNLPLSVITSGQADGDPNSPSTKYLEKGDFLRLGNLTFGYTFRGAAWERSRIKSARVYVNGQNLLLFTDYSGFDPEVDIAKPYNGVPSAGIDYLAYPKAKTVTFGINLTF